jgi:hypothetical protein
VLICRRFSVRQLTNNTIKTIYTSNRKTMEVYIKEKWQYMYQTFVDYDEEYAFYNAFIQEIIAKPYWK